MTGDIALMLAILAISVLLFIVDWLRVDVVALLVLLALIVTGLVTPTEAFAGFSSPAVVTVWAIFIVSGGLLHTGVANLVADRLLQIAGTRITRLTGLLMTTVGLMSGVMNNVGATAVLLPSVVSMSRRVRINPSRLLLPLAYGSLLGGMTTLIGTPPNILVSDALRTAGLQPFSLLDFAPVGLVALVAGVVYMVLVGSRLLPDRSPAERLAEVAGPDVDIIDLYRLGERLFRARIPYGSVLIGETLAESGLRQDFELSVIGIERGGESRLAPTRDFILRRGDVLLIEGMVDNLVWAEATGRLEVQPEVGVADKDLQSGAIGVAEVLLSPHSRLVGKTLSDIQFREKYNLSVLAILRDGRPRRTGLAELPLRFGDTLLVQGPRHSFRILQREPDFVVLGDSGEAPAIRSGKAPLAAGLVLLMLVLVIPGWLPIMAAALLAGVLMVITGCLTMDEAYQAIEWKAVFLVAGTLPLGIAMENTGTAEYLASLMVDAVGGLGPMAVLVGFYILTNLLTQFMSNAASTVLIAPIAIGAARQIGGDPRTLLMCVAVAASAGFLTPVAHQSNVLVMGPGGYRFGDYLKMGLPLDLITLAVVVIVLPLVFPWP
ncbi:MAG: SLC13 family permease [Anaerolineae bacterium]|nr:SLC13 family permease [Anaerolineae bacterium]